MLVQSRAVVLKVIRYNDESVIAEAFTEAQGCVSFLVRISRSRRAAVRHTLFRPLALLDLGWNHRPAAGLQRLRSASVSVPLSSLPYEPDKASVALFLAEFLHYALRGEPESQSLFRYVAASVVWLDTCGAGYANFHFVFLLRLTRFLGFYPNLEGAGPGAFFDLEKACFVTEQPSHSHFVAPPVAALLPKLMRLNYATMRLFRFSGAERSRLLAGINDYYRLHVAGFPELKSLPVLAEVFSAR